MREESRGQVPGKVLEAEGGSRGHSYLDLLPCHALQLTLLSQGEFILDHFGPCSNGELEVLPILHDFRHPLDVLPLLDEVVGQPWWKPSEVRESQRWGSQEKLCGLNGERNMPSPWRPQARTGHL